MFILSIVPIHLASTTGTAIYTSDPVDVSQHKIMELEALFSALILRQYLGTEVAGVNNSDPNAVSQMLAQERLRLLNQVSSSTVEINKDDSAARLTELSRMSSWVNTRISDLQRLASYLSGTGPNPGYISGVMNNSPTAVTAELNRAMLYKQMLTQTTAFWTQMANSKPPPPPPPVSDDSENDGASGDTTDSGSTDQTTNTGDSGSTDQTTNTGDSGSTDQTTNTGDSNTSTDNNPLEEDVPVYDNRLTLLALSKNKIVELSSLLNSLMYKESSENLAAMERDIMSDLSREINRAKTFLKGDGNSSKVSRLMADLNNIQDEKQNIATVEGLQVSVSGALHTALRQYYSNLQGL